MKRLSVLISISVMLSFLVSLLGWGGAMPSAKALSANTFRDFSEVGSIKPDPIVKAVEISNDTDFSQQWGLTKIQAPKAWNITHSSSTIKIAILDSGIDSSHIDLAAKVIAERNFTDSPTTKMCMATALTWPVLSPLLPTIIPV